MALPQPGIFALGANAHCFCEFNASDRSDEADLVRIAAELVTANTTVSGVNLVIGIRPSLWNQLATVVVDVRDFPDGIVGPDGFEMPATQADIWLWISGASQDLVFDAARGASKALMATATLVRSKNGWPYHRNQDLTGFIDGTENPPIPHAPSVALFGDTERAAGSSVALVQEWHHDLEAFEKLDGPAQERVFGRTKSDSTEFDDESMPHDAHVSRTSIKSGGSTLEIFRRSVPYGDPSDHGLVFIAFTHDQARITTMLKRMAGQEDGLRDALTRYSTPLSGSYFFIPAPNLLEEFVSET